MQFHSNVFVLNVLSVKVLWLQARFDPGPRKAPEQGGRQQLGESGDCLHEL
jgi:hypothetical protein